MSHLISKRVVFGAALAVALAVTSAPAFAETKVGSVVDSRILLGFKVGETAIGDFLPDGWNSFTLPEGPVGGANLIVTLIDRHVILDAGGKPLNPSSGPIEMRAH